MSQILRKPPAEHYQSIQGLVSSAINLHWCNFKSSNEQAIFAWVMARFEQIEQDSINRIKNEGPLLAMLNDTHHDEQKLLVRKLRWIQLSGEEFVKEKIRKYLGNRIKEKGLK